MPRAEDYIIPADDIYARLARFLGTLGQASTGIDVARQTELARRREEEESALKRMLGLGGLEERKREFDLRLQELIEAREQRGEEAAARRLPKPFEPYTLSPGQVRFGAAGEQLATVPREPEKPTEYAGKRALAISNLTKSGITSPTEAEIADEMQALGEASRTRTALAPAQYQLTGVVPPRPIRAPAASREAVVGAGPSPLQQKIQQEVGAKGAAEQQQPIGDDAHKYVLIDTGEPPPPSMSRGEVFKRAKNVSPQLLGQIQSARRGLSVLRELEGMTQTFPEGTIRGAFFNLESRIRAISEPEFAELRTAFATAIPALSRAAGEVGNLSESEQAVIREGIGIARTRESFAAGLRVYRRLLERGFTQSGIPLPAALRGASEAPTPSQKKKTLRYNPVTGRVE